MPARILPALFLSLLAGTAVADRAVLSGAPPAPAAVLERAGFEVVRGDGSVAGLRADLLDLMDGIGRHDRVVIHLQGQFARSREQTWFLGARAGATDLPHAGRDGLSLATVLEIAGRLPGGAFVLLGDVSDSTEHGRGLRPGIGALDIPQGVTVVRGPARQISRLAASVLYQPGTDLAEAVGESDVIVAQGFLPRGHGIVPSPQQAVAPAPVTPAAGDEPRVQEVAFWQRVRSEDTEAGYRDYLQRYPNGFYRAEARAALDVLLNDPQRRAEAAEAALALSVSDRRDVQRDLTLLGFDTRGIDGLFGPGTRAALRDWQTQSGLPVTGYMDRAQRMTLARQADALRAERAAAREGDARMWREIGGEDAVPVDLRRYLTAYPEGQNAARAEEILAIVEEARTVEAGRRDRSDWIAARRQDTEAAYRAYLEARPDGAYADQARARLQGQTVPDPLEQARAQSEELRLQMGLVTRILIERRLEQLGFNPGVPDGRFDDSTRQAIARYQSERGLPVTGYVSEVTAQRMLAEAGISFTRP